MYTIDQIRKQTMMMMMMLGFYVVLKIISLVWGLSLSEIRIGRKSKIYTQKTVWYVMKANLRDRAGA